jgi:hypothetical protein
MVNYFQNQANLLHLKAQNAGIFQNNPDTGDERENILIDFLRLHLPARCNVSKGGLIIDSRSNESKQVDIVVTNDLSLQFKKYHDNELQKVFNCIEGCYSVISVKSSLDKDDFFNALDNLYSVPRLEHMPVSPLVADPGYVLHQMPARIIFAYEGPDIETTRSHLTEHQQDRGIQPEHMVDLIVVNNKYHISKVGYGGYQDPGQPFRVWGTMQFFHRTRFIGGLV